ncbi:hypothetical protein J7355_13345 [Endozoicomonas sp. G2_2]|nr:hypothetical protein [Endozoicomonas sp. G2_2]
MSNFLYPIPNGRAGEAILRTWHQIRKTGIASAQPVAVDGSYLRVGFGGHHSNELILALLAGLANPEQAEQAQDPVWRLPKMIGLISSLDSKQKDALFALARTDLRPTLYEAVSTLIQIEDLQDYFEHEAHTDIEPVWQHYTIRPSGYAAFNHATLSEGNPPDWGVFDALRKRAQRERMDEGRRVALVTILSIYNSEDTAVSFKGRGWTLRAGALGRYVRDRAERQPIAFDAFVQALAVYPGW